MNESHPPYSLRCSICGISWPHTMRYKTCPICDEATHNVELPIGDEPLTQAEADALLVERGIKPVPGVAAPQGPRSTHLTKYSFKREKDKLLADLERWAKEVPPWMR